MSRINVKIGGKAQLNIGNMAQGRDINISSGNMNLVENNNALNMELLEAVRDAAGGNNSRVEAVQREVQELSETMTAQPQNTGKIKEILNTIKEHHGWAFPAISGIVNKVAPALSALL